MPTVSLIRRRNGHALHPGAPSACVVILLLLTTLATQSHAQMATLRNLELPVPSRQPTMQFLTSFDGAIEIARGNGSADAQQAWNLRLAASAQLAAWRGTAVFALFGHEMSATPYNDVGFSPRGAIWEEALLLATRVGAFTWQLGAFHRCRHEIDNDRPSHQSVPVAAYEPTRRVTVLSGWNTTVVTPTMQLGERLHLTASVRAERYPNAFDGRRPANQLPPDWSSASMGAYASARATFALSRDITAYTRGWASGIAFDAVTAWNHRVEGGVRMQGRGGAFSTYLAREHFFDDLSQPVPRPSTVWFAGVRLAGHVLQ